MTTSANGDNGKDAGARKGESVRPSKVTAVTWLLFANAALAIVTCCCAANVEIVPYWIVGGMLGTWFSWASLLAVWFVLSPQRFNSRLTAVAILLPTTCLAPIYLTLVSGSVMESILFCGFILLQWGFGQTPLWIIRLGFGWRLTSGYDTSSERSGRDEVQFGVKQLFVLTTVVAVLFAVGRVLIPDDDRVASSWVETIVIWTIVGGCNLLVGLPFIWATLVSTFRSFWLTAACAIATLICYLEPWIFHRAVGGSTGDYSIFWVMNVTHVAMVFANLSIVRCSGYGLTNTVARKQLASAPRGL